MNSQNRYRQMAGLLSLVAVLALMLGACAPAQQANPTTSPSVGTPATAATAQPSAAATQPSASPAASPMPAPGTAAATGSLDGDWAGNIKAAGNTYNINVRFQTSGSTLQAWLGIPAQGIKDFQFTVARQDGSQVHLEAFPAPRTAVFDGALAADGTLAGKYTQAGYEGTFSLARTVVQAQPTEQVPYRQEEVTATSGSVKLAGTLTLPPSGGPFPAAVLISGSGQQDRDEEIVGFKPFQMIADYLTRNGIAVLRVDDRGIGGSTGDFASATSEDFAGDVMAEVAMLKARPDINPHQIGLIGHSEGGLIAPMVATRIPNDIAFVVMLAGPGVPGSDILQQQVTDALKLNGAPQAQIDQALTQEKRTLEVIRTGQGLDQLQAEWRTQAKAQIAAMTPDQQKALGDPNKAVEAIVQARTAEVTSPWLKFFVNYDPAPTLAKVKAPVLALFGGKDVQVAAGPNAPAVEAALKQGGNTHFTVKTYPDANHLFQPAKTGAPSEYSQLKTFVPGLLEDITAWIKEAIK